MHLSYIAVNPAHRNPQAEVNALRFNLDLARSCLQTAHARGDAFMIDHYSRRVQEITARLAELVEDAPETWPPCEEWLMCLRRIPAKS